VELVERPNNVNARVTPPEGGQGGGENGQVQQGRLGIQGRTITPELAEQMKLKLKVARGVFVASVRPGSPAGDAGIQHGDVIHSVDRAQVTTVEELAQAVKSLAPGEYLFEVERAGRTVFLTITFD
jgi:serine protease Do